MMIMVSRSCSCSRLASHSFCASDGSASESESRMLLEMEGSESTSSSRSEEEAAVSGMTKDEEMEALVMLDEDMSDMAVGFRETGEEAAVCGGPVRYRGALSELAKRVGNGGYGSVYSGIWIW